MPKKRVTPAQELLATHLRELGYEPEMEYQFCADRRWRADLAIMDVRLLLEVDGGMWSGGHKRGAALEGDYEKQNTAQLQGWRILRFSNRQVMEGEAIAFLKKLLWEPTAHEA